MDGEAIAGGFVKEEHQERRACARAAANCKIAGWVAGAPPRETASALWLLPQRGGRCRVIVCMTPLLVLSGRDHAAKSCGYASIGVGGGLVAGDFVHRGLSVAGT